MTGRSREWAWARGWRSRISRRRFLLAAAIAAVVCLAAHIPAPPLKRGVALSHAIYDRSDRLLRLNVSRDQKLRLWVPLDRQSPLLVRATLLKEDRHFRFHPGVNPVSLARAVWSSYVTRDRRLGGSTLTMQLARIRYDMNTRHPAGKLKQILTALRLELFYSKDEILEAYLNLAPYGGNIEGAAAASRIYFSKQPHELSISEALALAVLPQKPARAAGSDWQAATEDLLGKWNRRYPAESGPAIAVASLLSPTNGIRLPFEAPHFSEALMSDYPEESVLKSTLDLELQDLLERQVARAILRGKDLGVLNAAAMIVDHRSMEVVAYVGSADYFDSAIEGQVNGARALRSPGSALKPFIYALGMDQGLIHPLTMVKDAPSSFGGFNPENFDQEFSGPLSAGEALRRSRNIPAVELATRLQSPDLYGFLKRAGVRLPQDRAHYGMALVLGGAEVTMEDLASLYATLANKGVRRPLRMRRDEPVAPGDAVLSPESAFLTLKILEKAPRPRQRFRDEWTDAALPVAWKTGTSFAFRDAWTAGVAGPYVIVVWIGNFDGRGNPAFVGARAAAPLFFEVVDALKSRPETLAFTAWPELPAVKEVRVCAVSGGMPGEACPVTAPSWFIPGRSPIDACSVHRQIWIDPASGLRLCPESPRPHVVEVREFWTSDLLKLYRQAGIPRRGPPPYHPECAGRVRDHLGVSPRIMSPQRGVIYNFRLSQGGAGKIPLIGALDADARTLYWFVNQALLGKAGPEDTLFWSPQPGRYVVRAVDDQGRADSIDVVVNAIN